jgi:hypothetical protein
MSELRRIQFVTRFFPYLQGLRLLPIGLGMLVLAAWAAWRGSPGAVTLLRLEKLPVLLLAVLPVLGLYALLGVYYSRTYGIVRQPWTTRRRVLRAMLTVSVMGMVMGILERSGPSSPAPTGMFLGLLGLSFTWCWIRSSFVAHHYFVTGVAMMIFATAHALGYVPVGTLLQSLPYTSDAHSPEVTLFSTWGLALVVLGLLDHRMLAQSMRPIPDSDPDATPEVMG